jgi:hypothetical protein
MAGRGCSGFSNEPVTLWHLMKSVHEGALPACRAWPESLIDAIQRIVTRFALISMAGAVLCAGSLAAALDTHT